MKTAISVPTPLFKKAERIAHDLGMSRNELYAQAVTDFIKQHQHQSSHITKLLDQIYEEASSALDASWIKVQAKILTEEQW